VANRDEKTFPALPQRRAKAREEGRIARSRDLTSAVSFLAAAAIVSGAALFAGQMIVGAFREALSATASSDLRSGVARALGRPLLVALATGGALAAAAVVGAIAQEGLVFAPKFAPDLSRLNPLKYFQRIFSSVGLIELAKAALKVTLVAFLAWRTACWTLEAGAGAHSIGQSLWVLESAVRRLFVWSVVLALVIAAGDYAYKRYEFEAELRMTRQEFLDAMKEEHGNPLIKRAIRKAQRKSFKRLRGINQAATASVVLTNPTHYAVAVRYRRGFDRAPLVVAKGAGEMAHRVIAIARLAAIPVVENRPLARAIYKAVEVGEHIPRHFYRAVAEVLAAIMRAEARKRMSLAVSA
jgi:flagellar biosynthetic protein FlhB